MKTLVTHEGVSRVLDHETVKDLRSKIRTFFGLSQGECKLEIYDDEWSCWTWLEDDDNITASRPRVRTLSSVIILDTNQNATLRSSQESLVDLNSSTGTESTVGVAEVEHETSKEATVVGSEENADSVLQTAEPSASQDVTLESDIAKPTPPLSRMDTVPVGHFDDSQLRPALRAKLRSSHEKQPLTRSEWSEVTSVIVSHEKVTNRSLNMTHSRYMQLADHALVQWPALHHGFSPKQALAQVKAKIQWRVRNEKRPGPSAQLECPGTFKRPAPPLALTARSAKKKKSPRFENFEGYQAYLPPEPEEDLQVHRNRLRQVEGITEEEREELKEVTFADRRRHAVALSTPMKKFLYMYPMLKNHEEIWLELERISGKKGSRLPEYRKRLLDYLTAVQMQTECEDDDRVDSLLEYLLVNMEEIFGSGGCKSVPHFEETAEGAFTLVVEGQRVTENLKMTRDDALLLWAASFPVFNQKAPSKTAKNVLAFVTENIFEKGKGSFVVGNRALQRIGQLKQLLE